MKARMPRYHQIAQSLRDRIRSGDIAPGARLDNQRRLAEDFGVTLNVDLTPEQWEALDLAVGESVYVSPTNVRLFVRDYAI